MQAFGTPVVVESKRADAKRLHMVHREDEAASGKLLQQHFLLRIADIDEAGGNRQIVSHADQRLRHPSGRIPRNHRVVVFVFGMPRTADLPSRQKVFVIDEHATITDGRIARLPFDIFPTERFKPSDGYLRPKIAWIDMQEIRAECVNPVDAAAHVRTVYI